MPRKILKQGPLTLSEVMMLLGERSEDGDFNYTQRVALDHATKFSRLSLEQATQLCAKLEDKFGLDWGSSVQVCNILPETLDELKIIISERYPDMDNTTLEAILKLIEEIVA